MADLQEHEASQTGISFKSQNASKKIPTGHLLVSKPSFFSFPHRNEQIHNTMMFQRSTISLSCLKKSCFYPRFRLRKVKMDQRKLMDNASTITDMAKVTILILLQHFSDRKYVRYFTTPNFTLSGPEQCI